MSFTETQIRIYALTKQMMDLSEKYLLATIPGERESFLYQIYETNEKLDELADRLKRESEKNIKLNSI